MPPWTAGSAHRRRACTAGEPWHGTGRIRRARLLAWRFGLGQKRQRWREHTHTCRDMQGVCACAHARACACGRACVRACGQCPAPRSALPTSCGTARRRPAQGRVSPAAAPAGAPAPRCRLGAPQRTHPLSTCPHAPHLQAGRTSNTSVYSAPVACTVGAAAGHVSRGSAAAMHLYPALLASL